MSRINNDQLSAAIFCLGGIAIAIVSVGYGLGTLDSPSTGFLPFLAALAIIFFSLVGIVAATLSQKGWKPLLRGVNWKNPLLIVAALLAYGFLMKPLGFLVSTVLVIGFLLRAVQPTKWPAVVVGAFATAIGSYLIFEKWLQTQLPKGPWGF
jgi:putative tricarboxylic transport membrane protein